MVTPTRVHLVSSPSELAAAQHLRYKVLSDHLGWFPRNSMFLEVDEWDGQSSHLIADRNGTILGTIRLILPRQGMVPMEQYWNLPSSVKRTNYAEISRFVVDPDDGYPPHAVSLALIGALIRQSEKERIDYWVVALDEIVWRLLKSLGISFEQIGEARHYMGSITIPGIREYRDFMLDLKQNNAMLFKIMFGAKDMLSVEEVVEILKGQD